MQIRVATLNVWGLPPLAPDVSERMQAIGARLASLDLDIAAFQEVWTPDARRILVAAGRDAGLEHAWHTRSILGSSGLLVLSRLPILEAHFERYKLRGPPEQLTQGDYYGGKGFARVRLATPDGPVTLIDTHLHARYGNRVEHEYRSIRTAQVVELALRSRETTDPIIAVGDFNCEEGHVTYDILRGLTGFRDTAAELGLRQPTVFRGNAYRGSPGKSERRIDFVFVRDGRHGGVAARRVRRVFDDPIEIDGRSGAYSNHAGVLAELSVGERTADAWPAPDRRTLEIAADLLSQGRAEARRRQRHVRLLAGSGVGGAILSLGALRAPPMTRRRLLRGLVQGLGLAAIAPAVGYSVVSEYVVPDEVAGFESVAQRLSEFDWHRADSSLA